MRVFPMLMLVFWLADCQHQPAVPFEQIALPLRDQLRKTWLLVDLKTQHPAAGPETTQRWKERLLQAGVLFHFFPDGQWAFIEGEMYHAGRWTLDESNNKVHCTYADQDSSATLLVKIRRMGSDSLVADLIQRGQTLSAVLKTDHYAYIKPSECPWHASNNKWRIKPNRPETDGEIKARFINHLRHYCTLLEAMVINNGRTITVKNSPSCIQIYSSGIGMRNTEKIDAAWFATFYDRRDAQKCLTLFRKMLDDDGVLTGPNTGNWASDDLMLLRRLMNRLQGIDSDMEI